MKGQLSVSDTKHLRRLLDWVASEIGPTPEEVVAMVCASGSVTAALSEEAKARLIKAHLVASNVPDYVRSAVSALEKVTLDKSKRSRKGAKKSPRAAKPLQLPLVLE